MSQAQAQDGTQDGTQAKPRLALVDGSGYIFRAYHALPPLTRDDGTPIGAVYGFTNMLLKLQDELEVDALAVVFDAARKTFRNELYPDYKANRADPPEDLVPQFALVREAADALNIARIEMDNYEADDLIASYARRAAGQGYEVVIVSSDKDLMQLVANGVWMYDPMKQRELHAEAVREKFGVTPDKVIEVQALIGDSSDNIPGVPGIGPKTAAQLIEEYGSLENVLAHAAQIRQAKRREALLEHADMARLSYELVKLKDDLTLPCPLDALRLREPEPEALLGFLQHNGFKTLLKKMEDRLGQCAPPPDNAQEQQPAFAGYELVTDRAALDRWVREIRHAGRVAIDTETTSLNARQAKLVGLSLSVTPGQACYIPVGHVTQGALPSAGAAQSDFFRDQQDQHDQPVSVSDPRQLDLNEVLDALEPVLSDPAILKIGQNIKYDLLVLKQYGLEPAPVDDSMLLSYVTAAGLHAHNMDELSQRHLHHRPIAFKDLVGTGKMQKSFAEIALEPACEYAAEDADITLRLADRLKQELMEARLVSVYETIERPLIPVIVAMEDRGIRINPDKLRAMSAEFAEKLAALEGEIHALAGHAFNVGSPKQLGDVLFEEMQLKGGKKSGKTGAYGTGADVLEELAASGVAIADKVLQWRQLSKLKSTYSDALVREIHPRTGRVHTSFSMAATTTGRLSSSEPNLQNIPIRTAEGRRIREAFVAEAGCKLISADYSQIELRLLADMAGIETLKQAFSEGRDIHAITASQMFGVPVDQVSGELRRKAKTINFGIIYGISAHGLATRLGIARSEAASYIDAYFEQYPGIKAYMERTKDAAREQGYVSTYFGRRVHVRDINAKNPNQRAFAERAAINAPLQGTAADIIKRAMIAVDRALAARFPEAGLLLQVHDELIVEAPEAQAEAVAALMKREMAAAAHLSVPLLVEAGIGDNWGDIH